MLVTAECMFMGVECRKGFNDASKTYYLAGFMKGLDSMRCYIDEADYNQLVDMEPCTAVCAQFDYNTLKGGMRFVSLK